MTALASRLADSALRARLERAAFVLAIAIVATLPYSTSATSVLVPIWLAVLLPTLDWREIRDELRHPRSFLPLALATLLWLGLAWGEGPGGERLAAAAAAAKLALLPFFVIQARKSGGGRIMAWTYILALLPVLALSFLSWHPPTSLASTFGWIMMPGVPFKDYIAQSGFFAGAIFLLAHAGLGFWRGGRRALAAIALLLAVLFLIDIVFVATGRTTLVVLATLAVIFVIQTRDRRVGLVLLAGCVLIAVGLWTASPHLRLRVTSAVNEVALWQSTGAPTSSGLRLEWWRRSTEMIAEKPILGHGTGSIPSLFRRAASGEAVAHQPHNEVLTVGLQAGLVGIALLLALWGAHALFFIRAGGLAGMIGVSVVAQNVVGSIFNSHLTDFTQGWAYVVFAGLLIGLSTRRERTS